MARATRVKISAAYQIGDMYGGIFKGMRRLKDDPYPRTFNILFSGFSRQVRGRTAGAYEGKSADQSAALNAIIDQELTRLFKEHVRPAFQAEAPEDPTDEEGWNAPWWKKPTLRESIMRSPLIKQSLKKGALEIALRMRWYGWLTIEGRRSYWVTHKQTYRLKDGTWVTKKAGDQVHSSTQYSDLLTGEPAEVRMGWAARAYYKSVPAMEAARFTIADRVMDEGLVMNLQNATADMMREQARKQRQADASIFSRRIAKDYGGY